MQNWKQILCWSGVASAMGLMAGCSGTLGDGVDLESITIRAQSATLDPDGNAADDALVIGQCVTFPLVFSTLFSDGEQSLESDRATWTSSDESVIAIAPSGLPIGIRPTNGTPVTVTAEFAGRTDSAEVEVLASSLVLELANTKFGVGIDTQIRAFLDVVGSDVVGIDAMGSNIVETGSRARPSANGVTNFISDNDNIEISTFNADSNPSGLSFGEMRASAPGSAKITATLNLIADDDSLAPCNAFTASLDVAAEAVTSNNVEIVPTFVSENSANQSSDGMLFLASNTGARVTVNAVFSDGQRQDLTREVTWKRTEDGSVSNASGDDIPNRLTVPAEGSGLILADDEDFGISPAPMLTATFIRGGDDTASNRAQDDLDDLSANLTVSVNDYSADNISLSYEPESGGLIPFLASTPYKVLATFTAPAADSNDPDITELVLDVSTTLSLTSDDGNDSDSGLFDFAIVNLVNGTVNAISKEATDTVNDSAANGGMALTPSHPVTVILTVDPDTNDADGVDDSVTVSNVETDTDTPATYVQGESDLENIQPDDTLEIALGGDQQPIPVGTSVCIEQGSPQQFDALLQFANEGSSSVLPALVTRVIQPIPGGASLPGTLWSITNTDSFVVLNNPGSIGVVNVIGTSQSTATLTASYINLTPDENNPATNGRIVRQDSITVTSAAAGQCP